MGAKPAAAETNAEKDPAQAVREAKEKFSGRISEYKEALASAEDFGELKGIVKSFSVAVEGQGKTVFGEGTDLNASLDTVLTAIDNVRTGAMKLENMGSQIIGPTLWSKVEELAAKEDGNQ